MLEYGQFDAATLAELAKGLDAACSTEAPAHPRITTAGDFIVRVTSFAFTDKETSELRSFPMLKTLTSGNLGLVIPFETIEASGDTPAGASCLLTLPILPRMGADEEAMRRVFAVCKPKLVALLGHNQIGVNSEFIEQNYLPGYLVVDGKVVQVRNHRMNGRYRITITETRSRTGGAPILCLNSVQRLNA
jgi:hypothetical protein